MRTSVSPAASSASGLEGGLRDGEPFPPRFVGDAERRALLLVLKLSFGNAGGGPRSSHGSCRPRFDERGAVIARGMERRPRGCQRFYGEKALGTERLG